MMEELLHSAEIGRLVRDSYGNYVVQKAVSFPFPSPVLMVPPILIRSVRWIMRTRSPKLDLLLRSVRFCQQFGTYHRDAEFRLRSTILTRALPHPVDKTPLP